MIVNYAPSGWEIITQRSHGLLAAQICAHWQKDDQPECWIETLIATAEHDDVYNEFENDDLLNENGGPVHYEATSFRKAYAERLMGMAETKSAYVALLVSQHIQFVHGADSKAKQFIASLKIKEKRWLKIADSSKAEVSRGYALLQFCDAMSLLLCQNKVPPEQRKIEISTGPKGIAYTMWEQEGILIVDPWPFQEKTFKLRYESRMLPQLSYSSVAEFRKAIEEAEVVTRVLELATKIKM